MCLWFYPRLFFFIFYITKPGYVTKPARLAMLDRFFKLKWTGWTSQPTSWNVPVWAMNEPMHSLVHGRLKKNYMNNMANAEHVVSDSKFKWTEKLVKDLLSALNYSKTIIEFQYNIFNTEKVGNMNRYKKNLLKSMSYSEYFELYLVTEPSDLDSETDNEN